MKVNITKRQNTETLKELNFPLDKFIKSDLNIKSGKPIIYDNITNQKCINILPVESQHIEMPTSLDKKEEVIIPPENDFDIHPPIKPEFNMVDKDMMKEIESPFFATEVLAESSALNLSEFESMNKELDNEELIKDLFESSFNIDFLESSAKKLKSSCLYGEPIHINKESSSREG